MPVEEKFESLAVSGAIRTSFSINSATDLWHRCVVKRDQFGFAENVAQYEFGFVRDGVFAFELVSCTAFQH